MSRIYEYEGELRPETPVISVAQMRAADAYTIHDLGVPSKELMRRAAQGVYDAYESGWEGRKTLIICGSGNNGGDGYALAEIMRDHGMDVELLLVSDKFSEDGQFYHGHCLDLRIPEYRTDAMPDFKAYDVFVDCIFGTGFAGVPREPAARVIRQINKQRERGAVIVSVDINSGMNGDTGEAELAVTSDLTVSIGYFKHGFFAGRADELIGKLVNVDIGIELPEQEQ